METAMPIRSGFTRLSRTAAAACPGRAPVDAVEMCGLLEPAGQRPRSCRSRSSRRHVRTVQRHPIGANSEIASI
jgi:hypothetical protein